MSKYMIMFRYTGDRQPLEPSSRHKGQLFDDPGRAFQEIDELDPAIRGPYEVHEVTFKKVERPAPPEVQNLVDALNASEKAGLEIGNFEGTISAVGYDFVSERVGGGVSERIWKAVKD